MELPADSAKELDRLLRRKERHELHRLIAQLATLEVFFTPAEVAKARRLPPRTVSELCKRGEIRAHQPLSKRWRIPLSAVREWDRNTAIALEE